MSASRVFTSSIARSGNGSPPGTRAAANCSTSSSGYAVERLGDVEWLSSKRQLYWGDIDTHGFAMLDRFRARFGQAQSFLMDEATFLAHEAMWVAEPEPSTEVLSRLTETERRLHRDLLRGTHGERLRLEQERIGFQWVRAALGALAVRPGTAPEAPLR